MNYEPLKKHLDEFYLQHRKSRPEKIESGQLWTIFNPWGFDWEFGVILLVVETNDNWSKVTPLHDKLRLRSYLNFIMKCEHSDLGLELVTQTETTSIISNQAFSAPKSLFWGQVQPAILEAAKIRLDELENNKDPVFRLPVNNDIYAFDNLKKSILFKLQYYIALAEGEDKAKIIKEYIREESLKKDLAARTMMILEESCEQTKNYNKETETDYQRFLKQAKEELSMEPDICYKLYVDEIATPGTADLLFSIMSDLMFAVCPIEQSLSRLYHLIPRQDYSFYGNLRKLAEPQRLSNRGRTLRAMIYNRLDRNQSSIADFRQILIQSLATVDWEIEKEQQRDLKKLAKMPKLDKK